MARTASRWLERALPRWTDRQGAMRANTLECDFRARKFLKFLKIGPRPSTRPGGPRSCARLHGGNPLGERRARGFVPYSHASEIFNEDLTVVLAAPDGEQGSRTNFRSAATPRT